MMYADHWDSVDNIIGHCYENGEPAQRNRTSKK